MGNSVAYPVHRTTDPAEAYAKARLLCGPSARRYAKVRTAADAEPAAELPLDFGDTELPAAVVRVAGSGDPGRVAERLAAAIGGVVLCEPERGC